MVLPCPFEGLDVEGGRELAAQAPEWCRSARTVCRKPAQRQGWPHHAGVGGWGPACVILAAVATSIRAQPSSVHPFEGAPLPFRGPRRGRRTGVGGTGARSGADLPAQCVTGRHSGRDSRAVPELAAQCHGVAPACPHSVSQASTATGMVAPGWSWRHNATEWHRPVRTARRWPPRRPRLATQ